MRSFFSGQGCSSSHQRHASLAIVAERHRRQECIGEDFYRRAYTAAAHDQDKEGYETLVHMVNKQWFGTLGNDVFNDFSGNIPSTLCFGALAIRMVVFTTEPHGKDISSRRLPSVLFTSTSQ